MTLVQLLIIAISALFLSRAIYAIRAKRVGFKLSAFWMTLWVIIIIVATLPDTTSILSKLLGVGRGVDVAVYFSILLIFFLVYKIMVRLEKIEYEITKIIRHLSLKDLDKK